MGRLTSFFISTGTFVLVLTMARRYAGVRASAITALLFSAFTFGVYFNNIGKTYAVVSFCLTAALFSSLQTLPMTGAIPSHSYSAFSPH